MEFGLPVATDAFPGIAFGEETAMISRYAIAVSIILMIGCTANHTANQTSVLPGSPGLPSQGAVPFNLKTKNIIHDYPMPNPSSYPYFMATGSDKNVWFTEQNQARIGKITQAGVVTEYPIPSGFFGDHIAAGTDGLLWFPEGGGILIAKITTAGHITEYHLPSGASANGGIAKGPEGNMWFTDQNNNAIGTITRMGAVTEYSLPTTLAEPADITAGPDGNMWFTEEGGDNEVGKITTGGRITEYPGSGFGNLIAAGPDGNLYATSADGFFVWQVTTAGVITKFQGCAGSQKMILGPDKQMWMTNCGNQPYFDEFNPKTHAFSKAITPNPMWNLFGITVGADGDVWISGGGGNDILVYEEKVTTIGIRLNGEMALTDPNYGFELGYAVGTSSTQTQTISLAMGESVQFKNVDIEPHSAAFLGNATANNAPWPATFNGSTHKSPANTAIGTAGWATGSLNPNKTSPIYSTGLPGFYMIGCQYHYNTNEMRTVIVVH